MPRDSVPFDDANGPVSLEITSGYASLGTYQIIRRKDGEYVQIAKDRPRRIDDEVPDAIPLPILPEDLDGKQVFVRGNYRPAPGHEQVKVTYTFTQDGDILLETTIQDTADDRPYLRYSHGFEFHAE